MRLVCCLVLLAACQPSLTPTDELDRTVKVYHQHLRWKRFAKAAAFVSPDQKQAFLAAFEPSEEQLNIDDIEVKDLDVDEKSKKAKVSVEAKFFKLPSVTLEKARVTQTWEKRGDSWWLVSSAEVPFFPEASSQPAK